MSRKKSLLKIITKSKKKKSFYIDYNILYSDIETKMENNVHFPRCISFIDNNNNIKSFKNLNDFIDCLKNNYNKSIIYMANFGRFDSTFILNYISKNHEIGEIDIIERNNIIYQIKLKKYNIIFRDSYLMIPMSLDKLGENFCKNFKKNMEFDYSKINEMSFEELEIHCINDCKVLKEGFEKFREIILNKFQIDIINKITLPSLSFDIFKLNYYDPIKSPITKNPYKEDLFIRRSYKGGLAEVYSPKLENGYYYDANSLYPTVMMKEKYPVGKGKFVTGESIDINNFIGFIECEVECDKDLDFLTYKHSKNGLITPKGTWICVYFHKEIIKALQLGYKIKFLNGFKYEKEEVIFDKFVNELYELRVKSESKEMSNVVKLILNSLYGRFGMKTISFSTKYISSKDLQIYKNKHEIKNIDYLGNDMYIVTGKKKCVTDKEYYQNSIDTETAVQIASCITAYARIFMYDFKKIPNNKCFYTDTDSIFLEKELDSKHLGKNLGQFKLVARIIESFFIAPKVYYYIDFNSKEKLVMKGVKSGEINLNEVKKSFDKIINNQSGSITFNRINFFKRIFNKMVIGKNEMNIKLDFPLNKRKKIIEKGKWVGTTALEIRNR